MADFIVVVILAVVVAAAARYIYKAKKNGAKCIGCAAGKSGGCCSCGSSGTVVADGNGSGCCPNREP